MTLSITGNVQIESMDVMITSVDQSSLMFRLLASNTQLTTSAGLPSLRKASAVSAAIVPMAVGSSGLTGSTVQSIKGRKRQLILCTKSGRKMVWLDTTGSGSRKIKIELPEGSMKEEATSLTTPLILSESRPSRIAFFPFLNIATPTLLQIALWYLFVVS